MTTLASLIVTGALAGLGGYVLGVQVERAHWARQDTDAEHEGTTGYPVPEPVGGGPLISEKRGPPPEPVELDERDTWGVA